jgi:phosphate transport system permease protein
MTTVARRNLSRRVSAAMYVLCIVCASIILIVLALITGYLLFIGVGHLSLSFFIREPIAQGNPGFPGGMANGLQGTLVLITLASLLGIPIGVLAGIYMAEYDAQSMMVGFVRFLADVLAGVPSIVVGILCYELLVAPVHRNNAWAGAAALAFIMIPIIARTTEEMLRLVPNSYREASYGLGGTKAHTIWRVVVPAAKASIVTGIMLSIARIAGETAPLLFTSLGNDSISWNLNDRFPSLTKQIYDYSTQRATPQEQGLAWAGILVLISLIFVVNLGVRYFTTRRK